MIVEDDDDLRMCFREMLERHGHHVEDARSGIVGLARILAEKPEVAVIDISMPEMGGYEVARRVRATLGRSMLLVAVTGYGLEEHRLQALAAGFDAHLGKPLDLAQLHAIIDAHFAPDPVAVAS
nr:response regulator [Deltaproteobacteria bacterium]